MNTDYGIYPESGEVVMEVVDKNTQYEHTVGATITTNGEATKGRRISDYDNMYGEIEEKMTGETPEVRSDKSYPKDISKISQRYPKDIPKIS